MRPRGFSLTELVVSLVVAGVIGAALTRLVINQARFTAVQDGMMRSRAGARAALNTMGSELRQVAQGGILQADADSITVRVPFALGVVCGPQSGNVVVSLLPYDSSLYATSQMSGWAWQDSAGTWNYVDPGTRTAGNTVPCFGTPPVWLFYKGASAYFTTVTPGAAGATPGTPIMLYQTTRYAFAGSAELPGRRALWRTTLRNNVREELVAPFDTSARFEYLVGATFQPRANAPAVLDSISGLRLKLVTESEAAPQGRARPLLFDLTTDIVLRNNVP